MNKPNQAPSESTDIFDIKYPGMVGIQTGKYFVSAGSLNDKGKAIGGGHVADFNSMEDAKNCCTTINKINPNHKPAIWEWGKNGEPDKKIATDEKDIIDEHRDRTGNVLFF